LKVAVKQQWGMPFVAQRFILDGTLLVADDSTEVGVALAPVRDSDCEEATLTSSTTRTAEPHVVELSVVRAVLPPEVQLQIDRMLLIATASGDHEAMAGALAEGASVNCVAAHVDAASPMKKAELMRSLPDPLLIALAARDEAAAMILRDAGATEPDTQPKMATLGQAFRKADLSDVARHLVHGASPNLRLHLGEGIRDTAHGTPLHACCAMHHLDGAAAIAALLCRLGADAAARDAEGDSPLAHARYFGANEVYDVLKANGAQVQGPYYSTVHIAGRRLLGWR